MERKVSYWNFFSRCLGVWLDTMNVMYLPVGLSLTGYSLRVQCVSTAGLWSLPHQTLVISFISLPWILWHLLRQNAHKMNYGHEICKKIKRWWASNSIHQSVMANNRWQMKRFKIPWKATNIIIVHHHHLCHHEDRATEYMHISIKCTWAKRIATTNRPINLEHNTFHIVSHLFGWMDGCAQNNLYCFSLPFDTRKYENHVYFKYRKISLSVVWKFIRTLTDIRLLNLTFDLWYAI